MSADPLRGSALFSLVRPLPLHRAVHQAVPASSPLASPKMLFSMIGRSTAADALKEGLDVSVNRTRLIASRVAQASVNGGGFAIPVDPLTGAPAPGEAVDV